MLDILLQLFHSHRHRHRSGWCGGAAAVHGTCRCQAGEPANNQHHYGQAPPWPAPGACTPHVQILRKEKDTDYTM